MCFTCMLARATCVLYLHVGQGHLRLDCLHDLLPLLGRQVGQLTLIHCNSLEETHWIFAASLRG